jgi:hypothetical protein
MVIFWKKGENEEESCKEYFLSLFFNYHGWGFVLSYCNRNHENTTWTTTNYHHTPGNERRSKFFINLHIRIHKIGLYQKTLQKYQQPRT